MTFILSEDKALRNMLLGVTVTDQKADAQEVSRPVRVYFGQPDQELTAQQYPYITIDMIDVQRDASREMRGKTNSEYLRPGNLDPEIPFERDRPIPVNIDYQITTYARHPRHDRELLAQVAYTHLPFRFGTLNLDDNTVRRLDVLSVTKRDVTEQAKRLFVNAITVRVSSEVVQGTLKQLTKVLSVHVDNPTAINAGGRPGDPHFVGDGWFTIPE